MNRKILFFLSVILSLALVMPLLTINIYAGDENGNYEKYGEAIKTLSRFGMIDGDNFDADTKISRGDFVASVMKITGVGKEFAPCDTEFSDVKKDYPNSGAVNLAYQMGIVNGFGDGTFGKDKILTKEQAASILVKLLGYEPYAAAYGGYPSGTLSVAAMQGVLKNVVIGDFAECTWGDAAQLIFNAMKTDVLRTKSYPESSYYTVEGENPMTLWMGIHKTNGVISSNDVTAYNGASVAEDGKITIDNVQYEDNGTGAFNYVGYPIKGYYSVDDNNRKLLCFSPDNSVREEYISAENIDGKTNVNSVVWYDENNLRKSMDISGCTVIYNGKLLETPLTEGELKPASGELRLVDTNGDKKAEIVYINSYDVMIVKSVRAAGGIITDKSLDKDGYAKTLKLDLKDGSLKYRIIKDGEEITIDKIKENNVLYVSKSKDGSFINITASSDRLKATVREIGDGEITLDNDTYKVISSAEGEIKKLRPGERATFYFTPDGKIAGYNSSVSSADLQYGYIIVGSIDMKGINAGKSGDLRIFTFDNKIKTYRLSDKIILNGDNIDAAGEGYTVEKVFDKLALTYDELNLYRHKNDTPVTQPAYKTGDSVKTFFCNRLVKFGTKDNGEISEIVLPLDNRTGQTSETGSEGTGDHIDEFSYDYSYHSVKSGTYAAYKGFGFIEGMYHTKGTIAAKTPTSAVWVRFYKGILGLDKVEKSFAVFDTSKSWGNDYKLYNCDIYDVSDTGACGLILEQEYSSIDAVDGTGGGEVYVAPGSPPYDLMIVDKLTTSVDEDGVIIKKMYGCYQEKYQSWTFDNDRVSADDLKIIGQGDVLRISVNGMGEIDGIYKIFSLNPAKPGYLLYGDKYNDYAKATGESTAADKIAYKHDWSWNGNQHSWNIDHNVMHVKYKAVEADNNGYTYVVDFGQSEEGVKPHNRLLRSSENSEIYVYDEAKKTVRLGTVDDIEPDNPNQTIVARNRYYAAYETIVINRASEPGTIYWYGPY